MTVKKLSKPSIVDKSPGMKSLLKDTQGFMNQLDKDLKNTDKMDRLTLFSKTMGVLAGIQNYLGDCTKIITRYAWADSHTDKELAETFRELGAMCRASMVLHQKVIPEHRLGDPQFSAIIEQLKALPEDSPKKVGVTGGLYNG